ncbi:MAG: hypothetical protein WDN26_14245 [Chitinophagaceae bacterium]
MKFILFTIAIATFSFASAQENKYPNLLQKKKSTYSELMKQNWKPETNTTALIELPPITIPEQLRQNYYTLPNGNRIYALAQDHMPCIVPDISQYNNKMVIKSNKNSGPAAIPNPATPIELDKEGL